MFKFKKGKLIKIKTFYLLGNVAKMGSLMGFVDILLAKEVFMKAK